MRYQQVGDATYVGSIGGASGGWSRPYFDNGGKAFVNTPSSLKELFAGIDSQIKTPLAFAIIAPLGWAGERAWEGFTPESMAKHGWQPKFWKESTHLDKTWVQLYMREVPGREWPKTQLDAKTTFQTVSYGSYLPGNLPYMGCSSFFMSWDTPETKVELPPVKQHFGSYHNIADKDVFAFLRVARPMLKGELAKLEEQGFAELATTPFSRYLVRAKAGIGTRELCQY